jgi:DNA mismatch repair ATPase MutS
MEFNTLTLQPTYKLCWGSAGSSNALDIAQALGFDSRVLAQARILARLSTSSSNESNGAGQMKQVGLMLTQHTYVTLLYDCLTEDLCCIVCPIV